MILKYTGKPHRSGREDTGRGTLKKKKNVTKKQRSSRQASGRGTKNMRRVKRHEKAPRPDVIRS